MPEPTRRREQRLLLSEEVRVQLKRELSDGTFPIGERLPSEPELAESYAISRPTLREILSGLERDGYVRRVHGVGTFAVKPDRRVSNALDLDIGVTEAITAANAPLDVEIIKVAEAPPSAWIARQLELEAGASALSVERVIRVDGVSATHGVDVIPSSIIEAAGSPAYDGGSTYRYLEGPCGVHLIGGMADIVAVQATPVLARLLGCTRNSPLLRLDQTGRSADGRPVIFSREHYVPGVISLTVHRLRRGRADAAWPSQ